MNAKTKEPCGCISDDGHWLTLCSEHEAERAASRDRSALQSLEWLIQHYERFPNEDNLHHVVIRIKELGSAVSGNPKCVAWIGANRAAIIRHARKATGDGRDA